VVALHRRPGERFRGDIPWDSWTPPGFVAEAMPTPPDSVPGAPPLQGMQGVMIPIPPPAPQAPEAPPEASHTPPHVLPDAALPNDAAVDRGLALLRAGRLTEALQLHGALSRRAPPPRGLGRLTVALRSAVPTQVDALILGGRCAAAQALHRQARAAGISYRAEEHFGSACQAP